MLLFYSDFVFHVNSSAINLTVYIAVNFTAISFKKINVLTGTRTLASSTSKCHNHCTSGRQFCPLNIIFNACNNSYLCSYTLESWFQHMALLFDVLFPNHSKKSCKHLLQKVLLIIHTIFCYFFPAIFYRVWLDIV